MRVIFAGGGTAGHINPALAIAKYIKDKQPDAEILFVGIKKGMESELVPKAGFDIKYIDVLGFKRSINLKNLVALAKVFGAFLKSSRIIKDFKPDIVIGTGGYVSGPVLASAVMLGIPTLIHEQNVFAGMTSKILSSIVDVVCISFAESMKGFKNAKKIIHTGNPLRSELFDISQKEARARLEIGSRPFIVAFGGSLGAKRLNDAVLDFIYKSKGKRNFELLLATGRGQFEDVLCELSQKGINEENVKVVKYIHNMDEVLAAADIVIARAGAITISEINALGKPSILIPSPNVTNNHQEYNARALEKQGAAIVFTEKELQDNVLCIAIDKLINDKEALKEMSQGSMKMGIKNGTQKIYNLIIELLKEKQNS